jgi:hypothetical protein
MNVLPAIRELFSQYQRAARCTPEVIAGLLWILCYIPEPVEAFGVEAALEPLAIERGEAA